MIALLPITLAASQLVFAAGNALPAESAESAEAVRTTTEPKQVQITYRVDNVFAAASIEQLNHYIADEEGGASRPVQPQGNIGGPLVSIGAMPDYAIMMVEGYRTLASEPVIPQSSPRVIVLDGQQAVVEIGTPVSFMEATGPESFRVVEVEGLTRGLTFSARPVVLDSGAVRFEELDITITEVVGRLNVVDESGADMGIPGGRPITRAVTYSLPVTLPEGEQALVQFETPGPEPQIVMLRLAAEVTRPGVDAIED